MPSEDVVAFKHAYCPECGAVENSDEDGCCLMCGADIIVGTKFDELMDSNERFMAALRRIAGELGEFADADGNTMVEKIRFFRNELAALQGEVAALKEAKEKNEAVLDLIRTERMRQDKKWGGDLHDDMHTDAEWVAIIAGELNEVLWAIASDRPNKATEELVHVAAVAVAWLEAIRRKAGGG